MGRRSRHTTDPASDLTGDHFVQDIHIASHELAEWADDPFTNNAVSRRGPAAPGNGRGCAVPPGVGAPLRPGRLSVAEVARRFDVSTDIVKRNIAQQGIPRRGRRAPLDHNMLHRLYVDERLGVRAVAARLDVSPDKVRAELARYRIPIRRPGRPAGRGS
ncbi:MAG: hypothetical protein LC792_11115 [Actinobacteria bacterium]|nr:hypothetical protein [Actinomycetota bacterium]